VSYQIAIARVARGAVVRELFQLSDVMEQRAGGEEILIRTVSRAECERRSRNRQDVLEESASIRVMYGLGSGPDAKLLSVRSGDSLEQLADKRITDVENQLLELAPHLFNGSRRAQDAIFLTESLRFILIGIHTPDLLDEQLQPAVEQIGAPLHFDKVTAVELFTQARRFAENAPANQTGPILKRQRNKKIAAAPMPDVLLRAQEEPPARHFRRQHADIREAHRRHACSSYLIPILPLRSSASAPTPLAKAGPIYQFALQ
jgi:hypothetical protein